MGRTLGPDDTMITNEEGTVSDRTAPAEPLFSLRTFIDTADRLGELRLGDDLDDADVVRLLRGKPSRWAAAARDHPVRPVDTAPLLANQVAGADVDLLAFPVPRWHAHDGGRFIGTGCLALTGYPPDDFVAGRVTLQDRIHPDDRDIAHYPGKHPDIRVTCKRDRAFHL